MKDPMNPKNESCAAFSRSEARFSLRAPGDAPVYDRRWATESLFAWVWSWVDSIGDWAESDSEGIENATERRCRLRVG